MARRSSLGALLALALVACATTLAHARARCTLEDATHSAAAAAHGGAVVTAASAALARATQEGAVESLAPGIFRAHYRLPLRPLAPGEVLFTHSSTTLLGRPAGRVAVLDWQFDIVDSRNRSVPLDVLYNHHFVVSDSAGVSLAEVQQGAAWPAALTSAVSRERYAALLKDQRVSFNAGPCEYARYIYGGGAEWRGVERDQAFDLRRDASPSAAWLTSDESTLWGLNLHAIDLRGVADVRSCVQCNCSYYAEHNPRDIATAQPLLGGGVQCCPDRARCGASAGALAAYTLTYAVTFSNNTALLARAKPLLRSVLTVESFAASNGYTCGVEYNPSTCGATRTEPPAAWAAQSTCAADDDANGTVTRLAFSWTLPSATDIELRYAVGHQHIGGRGIQLFATPPGGVAPPALLCDSVPRYGNGSSGEGRGFVVSMSACDFRARPLRLLRGTKLHVVSKYHADKAPLKEAAFQLPWQGTMGYINLEYTLADGDDVAFGVITADGSQQMPRAAMESHGAPQPVCVARPPPGGSSQLSAVNLMASGGDASGNAKPAASSSVVLATSPLLYTMDWAVDAARGVVAITLSVNATGRWFGIGVHSPGAAEGGMVNADMVVVQAAENATSASPLLDVAEYHADAYARPTRKADVGAGSGLAACAAEAGGGVTRVTFTRPLRGAADGRSQHVVPGERASVAWALGGGPRLAQHVAAGRASVIW